MREGWEARGVLATVVKGDGGEKGVGSFFSCVPKRVKRVGG